MQIDDTMVSIIIPAYNALRWLPETIAAALQQTREGDEILIIDDGSTDGTAEFVKNAYPKIRVISTPNKGCSAARSLGTRLAGGKYIKYLDADDLILEGILERQISKAEGANADVVYGNWCRIEESQCGWVVTEEVKRTIESFDVDYEIAFLKGMWCPTAAYLWRADFLRSRHPGWNDRLPVIQDAHFAYDAAASGARFAYDNEIGVHYRKHRNGSVSSQSRINFIRDCKRSTLEIGRRWKEPKEMDVRRLDALKQSWGRLARASYAVDRDLFYECLNEMRAIDPKYLPTGGRSFRFIAKYFGYQTAELFGYWMRRFRGLQENL